MFMAEHGFVSAQAGGPISPLVVIEALEVNARVAAVARHRRLLIDQ